MSKLYDIAKIVRSKNSGPFEITLDIIFDDYTTYARVKAANSINKKRIAELYNTTEASILRIVYFDSANGIKVTMARKISSGTFGDRDVYGAQQHAPLMDIIVD